jgi:hypothetical protein
MTCTTDNASNNNTFISIIENICHNKNISFTKDQNHVYCLAHIINLTVQDALEVLKAGDVENENQIIENKNQVIENEENIYIYDVIPKVRIINYLIICFLI